MININFLYFFSEIVGKYTQELRALGLRILDLISEGLGLSPNYFSEELSANPVLISHNYPPCPEPSLTLGASRHKDPNILTILFQEPNITALQVLKDGAWIPVEPIPDAFVVNMGFMLQVHISSYTILVFDINRLSLCKLNPYNLSRKST